MIPSKPPMGINVASDTKAGLRYADLIVDGHKTLESRNSDTLRPYVGKRVAIVRTGEGKAKAIGEVTIGEPKVVNQRQFRAMEDEHKVPKGSRFDINTPTKHLYPMHDPVRYEEERDVGHGIVSRQVIHKARGGTVQPTLDEMRLALAKGGKVEVRATVKDENLMRKIPQMEEAAKKVSEGKMTHAAYDKVIAKHKPIKPYEFVPKPASDEDANRALMENKKPHWRGHEQWPAGRKVGLRLDIPAYEQHGVWVNSIHDEEGKGEDKRNTSYGSVSSVKNATFDAGATKAIKVATGEQNKSPFARIKGDLHHMSEDEAVAHMQKNLNHPDYAQVGMDPRRHGYFYDRKTLQPVTHAKHVVQIGPLVLAHKPTYGERDTYAKGGKVNPTQHEMRQALLRKASGGVVRMAGGGILQDVIKPDVLAKKPNQLRGVVLSGASWMAGDEKTRLAKQAFGQDVTNTAIGGQKTSDVLNQLNVFQRDGGTFAPGTTVVLDIGANDIASGVDEETIRNNLNEIVSRLGNEGVSVILSGQPEAYSYDEAIARTDLQMDDLYRDIASNNSNVTLVDAMSEMLNDKTLMDESGFHLNSDDAKLLYLNQFANAYNNNNANNQIGTGTQDQTSQITAPLTQVDKPQEVYTPETQVNFTPTAQVTSTPTVAESQPSDGYRWAMQGNGLDTYYQNINNYLAEPRTQDEIQSAMQQYGVSQADVDAAKNYQPSGVSKTDESYATEQYAEGGKVEPSQDEMRLALLKSRRNGMYSPLEKLAIDIPRNKGTGAEFMAEISKQKGFKPEELADRKIPIPEGKMTKLEFLKHLRQHSLPPLQEFEMPDMGTGTEARNDRANDYYGDDYEKISPEQQMDVADWVRKHNAKYSQYQIPGGENYREMLLKLPALDIKDERSINYLQAEKRRTDPTEWANSEEGKRLEALMEKAKQFDEPYKSGHWRMHPNVLAHVRLSDREGPNGEKLLHLEELQSDWHQSGRKNGYVRPKEEVAQEMRKEHERLLQQHEAQLKEKKDSLFNELKSIKNQLRGMPSGASELGAQLRARELDIVKEFRAVDEMQPPEMPRIRNDGVPQAPFKKSWHELGMKHVLHHAAKNGYDGVVITPGDEQKERWGDEGLKVHYDKKIPEFLNKFGKPFGAQVGQMPIEYGSKAPSYGMPSISEFEQNRNPDETMMQYIERMKTVPITKQLHHFPINDQMRTSILKEGMPQYMRGGVVHKAEGGAVLPIEKIKADMMNRFKGLSQLQSIGAEEAPSLGVKAYVPTSGSPDANEMPVGGIDMSTGELPIGGIDMSKMQQGQQLMPNAPPAPAGMQQGMDQVPMGDQNPMGGMPPQGGSNILSMTPQGQAMAAMKPQGLAKGGTVNMARGGMPFSIKAPQTLPKAPSEFTPYDDTNPNIPSLSKAFDEAIAHHLSLSNEDRMINSQRAAMAVAQHTGMTSSGKPKDLLGQNEKLLKSGKGIEGQEPVKLPDGRGVETTGLALAPAYEEGNFNTCPNHHSCKAECLGKTSGNYFKLGGGQDLSEFKGPRLNSLLKTNAFLRDPHALAVKLYDEIDSAKQMAAANGNHLGVRLNVLSDINPRVHKAIIEAHPDVTFYDYTKNNTNPIAPNHHYTYSSTGVSQPGVDNQHTNWKQMRRRLDQGDNVAMAFSHKDHLPEEIHDQETGKKYKVIDGDTHDFRPLDLVGEGEDGVIVGLKNKKATGKMDEAHIDSKGFFLHYDPQLKMSTNAKGQPVYARTASNRISEKTGKPMLGETIPQNRTVNIQPQTRGMIPLTNDGEKQ